MILGFVRFSPLLSYLYIGNTKKRINYTPRARVGDSRVKKLYNIYITLIIAYTI